MPLGWSMAICSWIDRCMLRCRKGLVRPSSTVYTAANAAASSARSLAYSGCSPIHIAATACMGSSGAPAAIRARVVQKKRRTSFWEGWNIREL